MQRSWFLVMVATACAAGCDSSALVIEVHAPTGTEQVRLYIGTGEEATESIVPGDYPITSPPPMGTYWPRDPGNELDVITLAGGETTARFVFAPGSAPKLGAIIAIGFRDDAPIAIASRFYVAVPDGEVLQYILELATIPVPVPGSIPAVHLWGPAAADRTCVLVHATEPTAVPRNALVVNHADPDCDGYQTGASNECQPHVWNGRSRADLAALRCLAEDTIEPLGDGIAIQACTLGGPACVDGMGALPDGCEPSRFCAPMSLCTDCANQNTLDCAAKSSLAPRILCNFSVIQLGGGLSICPGAAKLPATTGLASGCAGSFQFRRAEDEWHSLLLTGTSLMLSAPPPTDACVFALSPSSLTYPFLNGTNAKITALLAVDLVNGRGAAIGLTVDFVVQSSNTCDAPNACRVEGTIDLGFRRCIGAPLRATP